MTVTYTLYCNCKCVGVCLRQRSERLNALIAGTVLPVNFPDFVSTTTIRTSSTSKCYFEINDSEKRQDDLMILASATTTPSATSAMIG